MRQGKRTKEDSEGNNRAGLMIDRAEAEPRTNLPVLVCVCPHM